MAFTRPKLFAKPTKGTSYTATGSVLPDPSSLESEDGSARGVPIRELVPQLASTYTRLLTYSQMMNDAGVDVSIRAAKTPILGADFYVDPYDDQDINEEIAQFVESNLFGGMTSPFLNTLEDVLHFYEDGYSVLEKVYENREWTPPGKGRNTKQYTMLRKLGVRPASTIKEIIYDDNGGPNGITQNAIKADNTTQEIPIDISKLLIFTFSRKGGDLTGKSLLRTAYPHWYYKTHMYKIDAIQKERHALGVPRGKLLPGFNANDRSILRSMLKNLRANEESFIIQTPTVEVDFAELQGNPVDVLESANHHNIMILMNVLVQFLNQGIGGSGGGRSSSGSQIDMFMKALRYVANYIVDVYNMYVIPELVVYNYKTTSFPKIKVRNIGETADLQKLGSALSSLFAQGAIVPDDPTENWVRNLFDMPAKDPSTARDPQQTATDPNATPTTPQKGGTKGGNGNGNGSGNVPKPVNAP